MSFVVDIISQPNLAKIESYFNDSSYQETIEFSANFNTRLCLERRLRLPFLDPQTGVAQNHSQLFMDRRNRMPGFRAPGQIYTYPAPRWRKSRRQYLNKMYRFPDRPFQALRKDHETIAGISSSSAIPSLSTASPSLGATLLHDADLLNGTFLEESSSCSHAAGDTSDSKDSQQHQQQQQHQQVKEDLSKEWFYDDMDMNDVDSLEELKSDDEYDYDPRYGNKKRRKRRPNKRSTLTPGEGNARRRTGAGRGRCVTAATTISAASSEAAFVGLDAVDGVVINDVSSTPTTSSAGRRPRGTGTRGRRRTKASNAGDLPPSPGVNSEPPSFESAAAAVGVVHSDPVGSEEHTNLRNSKWNYNPSSFG